MNRVSWRSPRGDWVLELEHGGHPLIRAVPRFDEPSGDRLGALWLPAPQVLSDAHPAGDAPARVFLWPRREDPSPDWSEAELSLGYALDGWIKVGRYRLVRGRIAVVPTSPGGQAAFDHANPKHVTEIAGWLAAVVERCDRCRASGAPLVWEQIVHA